MKVKAYFDTADGLPVGDYSLYWESQDHKRVLGMHMKAALEAGQVVTLARADIDIEGDNIDER